jgi:WD40 repeat protein
MRLIEVSNEPVVAVAVSADGRLLAASSGTAVVMFEWGSGDAILERRRWDFDQLAFSPDGEWLAASGAGRLVLWHTGTHREVQPPVPPQAKLSSGFGFAPDGKHLFACRLPRWWADEKLERWSMPDLRPVSGFDGFPPFPRLAVSPDGQYIGGVSPEMYELRIAVTGGVNKRLLMHGHTDSAFTAFSPDSARAVAGWDNELHVFETLGGRSVHQLVSKDGPFRDVAYTGSGRHLVTVDESGAAKLWNPATWAVERTYNWEAGPLTCVACTIDGLAAACGTATGQVLLFDVDE